MVLDEVFATRDWLQWQAPLEATGITLGIVQKPGDIATDEAVRDKLFRTCV